MDDDKGEEDEDDDEEDEGRMKRMLKRTMFDLIRRMASLPDLAALTHRL